LSKTWSIFDYYVANTLQSNGSNPDWSPKLRKNPRVALHYGDVTDVDIRFPKYTYYDLITGDCGIDVTDNFHQQEKLMYPLLLA